MATSEKPVRRTGAFRGKTAHVAIQILRRYQLLAMGLEKPLPILDTQWDTTAEVTIDDK